MPNNNPTGKGGFLDNPHNINKTGLNKKPLDLIDEIKTQLQELVTYRDKVTGEIQVSDKTRFQAVVNSLINECIKGNVKAYPILFGYLFGIPKKFFDDNGDSLHHLTYQEALRMLDGQVLEVQDTHDTDTIQ